MSSPTPLSWYAVRRRTAMAAAAAGVLSAAEIYIYGDIGESWYEETVSAANFVREINALEVEQIVVRISSFGGSVPDGLAIYNAMRRHKAEVVVEIDSVAYSIASLIAMGGDKVHMASNAMLMIHAPWTYAAGNSAELRELADQLDTWASAMSTSYAARTGNQPAALALLTDGKDHYFTAEEALAGKFIDAITDALPVAASAGSRDLAVSRYRRPTAAAQPAGLPAAAAAQPPEPSMTQPTVPAAATPPAGNPPVVDQKAVLAADRERRNGIRASFARFAATPGVADLQRSCEDDHDCDIQAAGQKLLDLLGKDSTPVAGGTVLTVEDETDKVRKATVSALLVRAAIDKPSAEHSTNPYRGNTLYEFAKASLARAGRRTDGMDKMETVAAAFTHSTSDFGGILSNVANKSMLKGYTEAEETFQLWTAAGTLPDFKPGRRVDLNMFPSLRKVAEGAEYKYATIGERGASVVLATYGELFSITRQAIINDDLDAFSRLPRLMGRAAIRTIGDLVYAILTGNPVMADGKTLFHADHGNLLPGSAITTDAVDAMGGAMALQKQDQSVLNIGLEYLIVPRALRGVANVVRTAEFEVGGTRNSNVPNSVRDTFKVITDARLDAVSPKAWYGAASSAVNDTIEVSYLDGNQAPVLEQKTGWNVDGTEFKVRMDAGVAPLDWKTLAKNPGPA